MKYPCMKINNLKIACVIPARLASSRFPRKVLAHLAGKPILKWIWERAGQVDLFDSVVFAVDAEETAELVTSFGGKYVMTSVQCPSGTDRIIEVMSQGSIKADIWVGWQADSPFISSHMIYDLLQSCEQQDADVWTLKRYIVDHEEITLPSVVKVVCDQDNYALYFSRSPIPYYVQGDMQGSVGYFKHVGVYAYTTHALHKIALMSPSMLEQAEQLEQLRFLQSRLAIKVHQTALDSIEINLPADLVKAEAHTHLL